MIVFVKQKARYITKGTVKKMHYKPVIAVILLAQLFATSSNATITETNTSITSKSLSPAFTPSQQDYTLRNCHNKSVSIAITVANDSIVKLAGKEIKTFPLKIKTKADQILDITIIEKNKAEKKYYLRCLPDDFPKISIMKHNNTPTINAQYLLASGNRPVSGSWEMNNKYYLILDSAGVPLWYMRAEGFPAIIEKTSDNNIITLASPEGLSPSYAARDNPGVIKSTLSGKYLGKTSLGESNPIDGHTIQQLAGGKKLLVTAPITKNVDLSKTFTQLTPLDEGGGGLEKCSLTNTSSVSVAYPEINIVDSKGKILWNWKSIGNINNDESLIPALTNIDYMGGSNCVVDIFHASHASISKDGKTVVLTTRFASASYGIDLKSKKIIWKIGGTKTPNSLVIENDPLGKDGPKGHHGGDLNEQGELLLYDNRRELSEISRAVVYQLDLKHKKAYFKKSLTPVLNPCVKFNNLTTCNSFSMGNSVFTSDQNILVSWGFKPGNLSVATLYANNYQPLLTIKNESGVHTTYQVTYLTNQERWNPVELRKNASSKITIRASWQTIGKPVATQSDVAVGTIK